MVQNCNLSLAEWKQFRTQVHGQQQKAQKARLHAAMCIEQTGSSHGSWFQQTLWRAVLAPRVWHQQCCVLLSLTIVHIMTWARRIAWLALPTLATVVLLVAWASDARDV